MKTDAELKQLAIDVYHGKVFTNLEIVTGELKSLLGTVFMPIGLGALEQTREWPEERRPVLVYEYMHKANTVSVNGYPTFVTANFLNRGEMERLSDFYIEYKNLQDGFLGKSDESELPTTGQQK